MRPRRAYVRTVCGCMPSMRAAMLMEKRSSSGSIARATRAPPCADPNLGSSTSRLNWSSRFLAAMVQPSDFVTIALLVALEALLSADNALVIAVMVLGLPKPQQQQALRYGIIGAFAFRTLATLLALYLMRMCWVKLGGAAYLLYLVYAHFGRGGDADARRSPPKAKAA